MPGGISSNFYGGAQGEYLAQYLLSVIGSAVVVPRQVDDGKDFYCSISRKENGMLYFESPYTIQVKTISDSSSKTVEINFGELTDKGIWKQYEIDWLSKQQLPLFIGIVSKEQNSLKIYSTSPMWFVFHQHANPSQIKLSCRLDNSTNNVGLPTQEEIAKWQDGNGDGYRHTADLGPPIAEIDVTSIWNEENLTKQKRLLKASVEFEMLNILYRNLGVPYFTWPLNIQVESTGIIYPPTQTNQISNQLANILFATAVMFFQQNELNKFNHIKSLLELLPRNHFPAISEGTSESLKSILTQLFES